MEIKHNFLNISNKLSRYRHFAECLALVLVWKGKVHFSPEESIEGLRYLLESGHVDEFLRRFEAKSNVIRLPLEEGELIFVRPGKRVKKRTLRFVAKELEELIWLDSTFDVIFNAGKVIASNLQLKPLLNQIMSLCEEILDVEVTAVILLDEKRNSLYWEVSRGEGSDYFSKYATIPLGQGIAGSVAVSGEAVLVNDVYNDPRWCPSYDSKSGFHTRSVICVPIVYGGRILGVIEAINKRKGKFEDKDLMTLECIAGFAGSAIENARIYEQLSNAYEELKSLDKAREKVIT